MKGLEMIRKCHCFFLAFTCLFGAFSPSFAADKITSAKCVFTGGSEHFFDDDKLTYKTTRVTDKMEISFDQLNSPTGDGRMLGNNGSSDVTILQSGAILNILEITGTKNINLTTLYTPKISHGAKVQAVISRHVGFSGLIPSQRVGYCTIFIY